jgi:hypothetical protein
MNRASYIPRTRQRIAGRTGVHAGIFAVGVGSAFLAISILISSPVAADGLQKAKTEGQNHAGPRVSAELTGSLAVRDGQRLHLVTDLGNIIIRTQNSGKIDYKVHLEADATQKDAKQLLKNFIVTTNPTAEGLYFRGQSLGRHASGRLWVTVEVNVPRNFNLDVSTGGGNIEAEDIIGTATLGTSGGNIVMANVGGAARLSTDGGHITVKNVAGALAASTGGGHITTGTIAGNAILHTDGGHIRVASVEGVAHVSTGGGNVSVEHSGSQLVAETNGGQIDVGETAGLVQAKTGGGGIRVVRLSGPTNLETSGGSIYLTEVDSAVKASTGAGAITAWFVTPGKMLGQCELQSGQGDIVVYIPRQLPVTIDAQVQSGDEHHVIFDPAFPVKISREAAANGDEWIRTEGALNGGGEVIRLRTVAGNIHVMVSDANKQVQLYKQQMEQLQQKLQLQLRMLQQQSQQMIENSP